jgi:hypothetical protein
MGTRTGGRQKGSKNVVGKTAKENIVAVFTRLGGTAEMAKWAKDNQTEFYRLYGRLIPVENQVSGPGGGAVEHKVTISVD